MKQLLKRGLAAVLALVMCVSMLNLTVFAAEGDNVLRVGDTTTLTTSYKFDKVWIQACGHEVDKIYATGYEYVGVSGANYESSKDITDSNGTRLSVTVRAVEPGTSTVILSYKFYCPATTYGSTKCKECDKTMEPSTFGGKWFDASKEFKITVYADYTLSYAGEGVNISPETKTEAKTSATFTAAAAPTREGYTFKGWSDGTTTYQPGDTVTLNWTSGPTASKTLTAVWDGCQHECSNWHQTKAPTCTEQGEKTGTCTKCGATVTDPIAALGHDWGIMVDNRDGTHSQVCKRDDSHVNTECNNENHTYGAWSTSKEPSCTEQGEKTRICTKCGATEQEPIAAWGHDLVTDSAVEPTCLKEGKTAGSHCQREGCGYVETEQKTVPALEPIYSAWTEVNAAYHSRHCTRENCNNPAHKATGSGNTAPHLFGDWTYVSNTEWTAVENDPYHLYRTVTVKHTCADCGYEEEATVKFEDKDRKGVEDKDLRKDKDAKTFDVWYLVKNGGTSTDPLGHETVTLNPADNAVAVEIKSFDGYAFDAADRMKIDFIDDPQYPVHVYYTRNNYTLTVAYTGLPEGTLSSKTSTVAYGADISVGTIPSVTGYTGVANADNPATMPAADTTIYVDYTANEYNLTVEYTGLPADLTPASVKSKVAYGADISVGTIPSVTGYTGVANADNPTAMPAADATIYVDYSINQYTLTINYVYEDGTQAAEAVTQEVNFGAAYSVDSPAISGYKTSSLKIEGTMPADDVKQTVTYVPLTKVMTVIHYVYEDGTTAAPDVTLTWTEGDTEAPTQESPSITGFTVDTASVVGSMTADTEVTVTYIAIMRNVYWNNWNGERLASGTFREVDPVPAANTFSGRTPTRGASFTTRYEWIGWSNAAIAANGDVTYTARFRAIPVQQEIEVEEPETPLVEDPENDPENDPEPEPAEPVEIEVDEPETPMVEEPEIEVEDPDVPMTDVPVADVPVAEVPVSDPEIEIDDPEVPLSDVPQTGDRSIIWGIPALISGTGLVWLALDKKREEDAE